MNTHVTPLMIALLTGAGMLTGGCEPDTELGPPAIRLDDSVCAECDMILSDERFACATYVEGVRGPDALLFDDVNCQVYHELAHPDRKVIARWSHDHGSSEWIRTEGAWFLWSKRLRTPMASHAAAFRTEAAAAAAREELGGDVMSFEVLARCLTLNGGDCAHGAADTGAVTGEPGETQKDEVNGGSAEHS